MPTNLKGRSILTLDDLNPAEIRHLLRLATDLKAAKSSGVEVQRLKGKNIALIFEKDSTRTRTGFEVAAYDQGSHVTYLGPTGSQIGHKESMKDTARVLGRMYDAIEFRGFSQQSAQELAAFSGVPVYNGLTDEAHPTQVLADALTMMEYSTKPLSSIGYAYLGDARFNMGNSLMVLGCKLGMDVRLCAPRSLWPKDDLVELCRGLAKETGARLLLTENVDEGVRGVDYVHTDVWVSMGEPASAWKERIRLLRPYQVNQDVFRRTGNPHARFMHCLPAFHNRETKIGAEIYQKYGLEAMEVDEAVFESDRSVVFDQAENRLHTIKAILVATLASQVVRAGRRPSPRGVKRPARTGSSRRATRGRRRAR